MSQSKIPLVSNHLPILGLLKSIFVPKEVKPNMTKDEIMFQAGQQSVLAWLDERVKEEEEYQLGFK